MTEQIAPTIYLTAEEAAVYEQAKADTSNPVMQALCAIIYRLEVDAYKGMSVPSVPPDPNAGPTDPPMDDKACLDYLAGMVLGDLASTGYVVVGNAQRAVRATGRTIQVVTGD